MAINTSQVGSVVDQSNNQIQFFGLLNIDGTRNTSAGVIYNATFNRFEAKQNNTVYADYQGRAFLFTSNNNSIVSFKAAIDSAAYNLTLPAVVPSGNNVIVFDANGNGTFENAVVSNTTLANDDKFHITYTNPVTHRIEEFAEMPTGAILVGKITEKPEIRVLTNDPNGLSWDLSIAGTVKAALVQNINTNSDVQFNSLNITTSIQSVNGTFTGDLQVDGLINGFDVDGHINSNSQHGAIGELVGQHNTQELTNKSIQYATMVNNRCTIQDTSNHIEPAINDLDTGKLPRLTARVVADGDIDLNNAPSIISGEVIGLNDVVLLTKQTFASENGLYSFIVGLPNTLVRHTSLSKSSQFLTGVLINVYDGLRKGSQYVLLNNVSTLETDPVTLYATSADVNSLLKVISHPTNTQRVIVTPSTQVINGEIYIQELNGLPLLFDGAEIDFSTGNVYKADGVTPFSLNFATPVITLNNYKWCTITVVPKQVNSVNQMEGQILVQFGSDENLDKELANRAYFGIGKPLAQIPLKGDVTGIYGITQYDIQKLIVGGGSASEATIVKEIPEGIINGINNAFILDKNPIGATQLLVFKDRGLVPQSQWTLENLNEIVFIAGDIPQLGQSLEAWYVEDPFGTIGGGGGSNVDLTNITVDIRPDTPASQSIGTATTPWRDLFLQDKTTGDVYRLEVDNGVFQVELVV